MLPCVCCERESVILLQGKSTTLQDALRQQDLIYVRVFNVGGSIDITGLCLAHKKPLPNRIDDGSESHVFEIPIDFLIERSTLK